LSYATVRTPEVPASTARMMSTGVD
jgi:hypothetical protein